MPDAQGHFGPYGGRFVPETLMHPLQELENEYLRAQKNPAFKREFEYYLREFCGRPTPLYFAERLTRELGGVCAHGDIQFGEAGGFNVAKDFTTGTLNKTRSLTDAFSAGGLL